MRVARRSSTGSARRARRLAGWPEKAAEVEGAEGSLPKETVQRILRTKFSLTVCAQVPEVPEALSGRVTFAVRRDGRVERLAVTAKPDQERFRECLAAGIDGLRMPSAAVETRVAVPFVARPAGKPGAR